MILPVVLSLLLLLLLPSYSVAAIDELTGQRAVSPACNDADDCATAYPGSVTANSMLFIGGTTWDDPGSTSITVTDSLGTSYTTVLCDAMDSSRQRTFYAYGITPASGANTITVNPSGASANYIRYGITEFTSVDPATPLSVDGGNSSGTGTSASDGITTATANELIVGVLGVNASSTITEDGAWTLIAELQSASLRAYSLIRQIVTSATAYTASWTLGTSSAWSACTVSFKEPSGSLMLPMLRRRIQ